MSSQLYPDPHDNPLADHVGVIAVGHRAVSGRRGGRRAVAPVALNPAGRGSGGARRGGIVGAEREVVLDEGMVTLFPTAAGVGRTTLIVENANRGVASQTLDLLSRPRRLSWSGVAISRWSQDDWPVQRDRCFWPFDRFSAVRR